MKTYGYGYDKAGNRISEKVDGDLTTGEVNNLNQLLEWKGIAVSGTNPKPLTIVGTVSPAATVTLQNVTNPGTPGPVIPARTTPDGTGFEAEVDIA